MTIQAVMNLESTIAPSTTATPPWVDRIAYPFRWRQIDLADGPIHYIDEGQGETLLFVHGTPTWSFEYRHLIAGLCGSYRCVALDHLGFGLSGRPEGASYTPEAHAERLRAFVERLGLKRFTLVAHDFGGPIALPLALADQSPVSRLVIQLFRMTRRETGLWSVSASGSAIGSPKSCATSVKRFRPSRSTKARRRSAWASGV